MNIPPRFLDEIRNRLTLSEIIGRRIKITRAGREFKACCPFHQEKTPSFTINDQKQFFHCFGCGAHGDVIGFVMRHDNLSFPDAVETLAGQAGLSLPKPDSKAVERAEQEKSLYNLMDDAASFFQNALSGTAKTYITERGLSESVQQQFRIGFAPADGQALRKHLATRGYTDAQMTEAGLLKPSSRGKAPYGFFRERIMFPVTDRRGRVVAFGGRILPDHLRPPSRSDFTPPKYINSPDTPLFDKSKTLYGESLARQAARDGQDVILTEGYMDVIACHQAGFKGAVAPMGTAVTEAQILALWSMCPDEDKTPILCFDGDSAGRRAAARACERLLPLIGPGRSAGFSFLPDGEDPDTLLRRGGKPAFRAVLDAALPLFEFLWSTHITGRSLKTPEARAAATQKLHDVISAIAHKDVQTHYRRHLNNKISETFFPRRQKGAAKQNRSFSKGQTPGAYGGIRPRKPVARQDLQARIFLAALINHPDVYSATEEFAGRIHIPDPRLEACRQALLTYLDDAQDGVDTAMITAQLQSAGFEKEISDILNESVYVHASFSAPRAEPDTIETDLKRWIDELQARNWQEINQGWKHAFVESDLEYEKKLKAMIEMKRSGHL